MASGMHAVFEELASNERFSGLPMRLEGTAGGRGFVITVDVTGADLDAVAALADFVREHLGLHGSIDVNGRVEISSPD